MIEGNNQHQKNKIDAFFLFYLSDIERMCYRNYCQETETFYSVFDVYIYLVFCCVR